MAKFTVVVSDTPDGTVDVVRTKVFPASALTDPITRAGMLVVVFGALTAHPELVDNFYGQYIATLESEMAEADESTAAAAQ